MEITIKQWPIKRLVAIQATINPRPQFQRGEVWNEERKQLLIDSILRNYDLPKIYLSQNKATLQYDYDVADGQQRLRAIWDFFADRLSLGQNIREIATVDLSGLRFSGLPNKFKKRLQDFKLTIALINKASQEELRTLFGRLQMGVILNPAELRNAISSALGSVIDTAAETHAFFTTSKIGKSRFKRQDFLTHAVALAHYQNSEDLKAKLLARLYREQAFNYDRPLIKKAYDVLDCLNEINQHTLHQIRNKWAFVDLFWFLFQHADAIKKVDCQAFAKGFVAFESDRTAHNSNPEVLLNDDAKKYLYDYIQAFNTSGALTTNIMKRNKVITVVFKCCVNS